jgi:hypothetical protein
MKGTKVRKATVALWLGLSAYAEAQEEEPPQRTVEYGFETDMSSRYLFRGVPFSQEPVSQLTAWTSFSGVSFYAFGNVLLKREPGQNDFNELDFGASYSRELGPLTLEPAFDAYVFRVPAPRRPPHTLEGAVKASCPLGPIEAFTNQTVDLVFNPGAYYAEAGLSFERAFSTSASIEAVLTFAWASSRFNSAHVGLPLGGFNHVGILLSLTYIPRERFYLRPHFELASFAMSPLGPHLAEPTVGSFGLAFGFLR